MEHSVNFNMGKVMALKAIRDKSLELNNALTELGEPMLHDLSLLPKIYNAYLRVFERRGCPEKAQQVYNRKKFLLIALYLYSPMTLAGDRMRLVGLRDKLSELFGLNTSTPISDNLAGLALNYNTYRDFRRDVNIIFDEILTELKDEEELNLPD